MANTDTIMLEIVDELNTDIGEHFFFSLLTTGWIDIIYLNEVFEFGYKLPVYNSDESLPQSIEEKYECDEITKKQAIIRAIRHNFARIKDDLLSVHIGEKVNG